MSAVALRTVTMPGLERLKDVPRGRAGRLRPVPAWEFPGRPHRSVLVSWLDSDQAHLRLTQAQMAQLLNVGLRTYVRFRTGEGKLGKQLRLSLLHRYPRWKRTIEGVAEEDRRLDDLLAVGR